MMTTQLFALEIKVVLKIESNAWGILRIVYFRTNSEALTVLCFVAKRIGSG